MLFYKKKVLQLAISTIALCSLAYYDGFSQLGQGSPLKINVIPPSPEAASLGKFGEVPVSYYTGIPDISIPLVQIAEKNLAVNVGLSYHAGGIKVEETASRVGLGWALNAADKSLEQ